MSASQFIIYRSTDSGAPVLTGAAGSLLNLLNGCLVNGYGSKTAAGWTKPYTDSGSIGCYQQGAGAELFLSINDNGPGAGTYKEARASAFEALTSNSAGSGPFPSAVLNQGVTPFGFVVIRKSTTADSTARAWIVLADASTFHLFVLTGDSAGIYFTFAFGDLYSLKGASDAYRCFIAGRNAENSGVVYSDTLANLNALSSSFGALFAPRTSGGGGFSIALGLHGDAFKGNSAGLYGPTPYPNNVDSGLYLSPVWMHEPSTSTIRGRLRGAYQICHNVANFSDGDTFTGTGDYAGKTFLIIRGTQISGGFNGAYCFETSATLETN